MNIHVSGTTIIWGMYKWEGWGQEGGEGETEGEKAGEGVANPIYRFVQFWNFTANNYHNK